MKLANIDTVEVSTAYYASGVDTAVYGFKWYITFTSDCNNGDVAEMTVAQVAGLSPFPGGSTHSLFRPLEVV